MKQFILTPAMGKRLIAKAICKHPAIEHALAEGTICVVAGTTNGYVAEELLNRIGQAEGFRREGFRRGVVVPPGVQPPPSQLDGDVIIQQSRRVNGKTVFQVIDELAVGDVVLKGANALDLRRGHAGVYVGHPQGGTIGAILPAVCGRRVRLIIPVGLEKRVAGNINDLAAELNDPETEGPRMVPMPGEVFTELDALAMLTGAAARMLAGGGIHGAEGAVWIGVHGSEQQLTEATELLESLADEGPCQV
jgi:hypothetical protein